MYYQLLSRQGIFFALIYTKIATFRYLSHFDVIGCILLGSFATLAIFFATTTFYYRKKARALQYGGKVSEWAVPFTKFLIIPSVQLHGENIRKKWRRWRRRRRRQQGREEGEGGKEQEQVQEEGAQLEVSSGKIQATYFWKVSPCSPNIYSQAEQDESILYLSIEEVFIPSAFSSLKYLKSHPDGEGQWEEAEKKRQASRHPAAAAARLPRPRHDDVGRGRGALPWTVWRAWRPYREAWHLIQTGDNGIRSIKSI